MPSTPSTSLRLEEMATGENLNVWGTKVNTNYDLLEQSICGKLTKSLTTSYTLVATNYASDEARPLALFFTDGGLSGVPTVTIPAVKKTYWVRNSGSTYSITITAGGVSVSVRANTMSFVYCDGTDCYIKDDTLDKVNKAAANVDINSHKLLNVTDPTSAQDGATKNYVDTKTLDTFAKPVANLDANTHKILNVTDPTLAQDAATKNYVDTTTSTQVQLAQDWADKTSAIVAATDWSSKAYAVGATGGPTLGNAKDWATSTAGLVASTDYSSKEFAQGTHASTGGSAKNWAQQTGADVTGAAANSRSAKSWAQDANTGATLGGSAKDWAQTTGATVDGTNYSAKEHAVGTTTTTGSAKDWATKTSGEVVTGQGYGAQKYANDASASATSAGTAATNAATSAASSSTSATAASNSAGLQWLFDTTVTMADPGSGNFRLNNATIASATAVAFSQNSSLSGNPSVSAFVKKWADSTSSVRGHLIFRKVSAVQNFAIFSIASAVTDNTTWQQITLTYVGGSGTFSASDAITVVFSRTGDAGTGDMSKSTYDPNSDGIIAVAQGGTNSATASGALTNLGAVAKAGDTMTGGLVANAATTVAGQYAVWDTNSNLSANNLLDGFTTTATAAAITTLTISGTGIQVFTGSTTQTVKLPTTSVPAGGQYLIINASTGAVTVQSSGANTICVLAGGTSALFTAQIATPTTAANWNFGYAGSSVASGKLLTVSNTLTLAGTDSTTMTFPGASCNVGYLEIPQNSKSAAYTTVLSDSGKHIFHPSADTTARTFTIDSNANVAYPVGTVLTFINQNSAGTVTIAITTDTMRLAGPGTTGSRTLATNGVATAVKVASTEWLISGTGLT